MKINVYATLRQIVGAKTVQMDLPVEPLIQEVLEQLAVRYPGLRTQLFDESGQVFAHVHLFVNRKDITYLPKGLQAALQADDTLDIFPAMGGG